MDWQPIETAPKDGTIILGCGFGSKGYFVDDVRWIDGAFWAFDPYADSHSLLSTQLTHWMPLPPPPSEDK